jgi:chemotaxis protein CheD
MSLVALRAEPKLVAGIAEMVISNDPADSLVTYALGSCLGLALHDPVAGVGALIHLQLPSSSLDPARARSNPERFVDTGVPAVFKAAYRLGAQKDRIVTYVTGGASMIQEGQRDSFQTGKRNLVILKRLLWKNGVFLKGEDVGGRISRTVTLSVDTGEFFVKANGETRRL